MARYAAGWVDALAFGFQHAGDWVLGDLQVRVHAAQLAGDRHVALCMA